MKHVILGPTIIVLSDPFRYWFYWWRLNEEYVYIHYITSNAVKWLAIGSAEIWAHKKTNGLTITSFAASEETLIYVPCLHEGVSLLIGVILYYDYNLINIFINGNITVFSYQKVVRVYELVPLFMLFCSDWYVLHWEEHGLSMWVKFKCVISGGV